jgi:elongator complex protein 1
MDEFEELQRYMEKHQLYGDAIELYKHKEECLQKIMFIHADYLVRKNKFKEAGISKIYIHKEQATDRSSV